MDNNKEFSDNQDTNQYIKQLMQYELKEIPEEILMSFMKRSKGDIDNLLKSKFSVKSLLYIVYRAYCVGFMMHGIKLNKDNKNKNV